jgi:flagellin-like protein
MRKIFKSKKALSPVVAAIILIAVTVAVSIAVAAWMGALTFTFMKTEELKIQSNTWDTTGTVDYIDLSVKNTGTSAMTISAVRVNDVSNGTLTNAITLQPGDSQTIRVSATGFITGNVYVSGTKYEFAVISATGNKYPYVATAP